MRVLVCGGRDYRDNGELWRALDKVLSKYGEELVIIHGGAKGADSLAGEWCISRQVPFVCVPARWGKYGKAAGMRRNKEMRDVWRPDACIACAGGVGTMGMIRLMQEVGIDPWKIGWRENSC